MDNKIIYRIAILLSAFFILNCGGSKSSDDPKPTCAEQKLSTDSTGACFKAEATPATLQELVDLIDKKYTVSHDADLNKIDVSKITKMTCLFADNASCVDENSKPVAELTGKNFSAFNGKIDKWNVSSVKNMYHMFAHATNFSGDLSHWNVGSVTNMGVMFNNASKFNSDIAGWNVSNVVNMRGMFSSAVLFNQDISGWNVSNVTSMNQMFKDATKFDQDLSKWDVGKVTDIGSMFEGTGASPNAMSHPMEAWKTKLATNVVKTNMFKNSAVATAGTEPSWCTTGANHC